ncbi:YidC/Oxa1 family membrane protein insertase [Agromyces aerolatus]|uniref:YidC/Oxa1 family membrane protein insertase n=1 Tax=Agromyces sp. LY-1074 TaxID=3074080 RepID=UPI002864FEB4|nr:MULTISPECIES: membrane protein insertase YidC [unclassified Agromyces]MDR5698454.1 membrane protein insertase YidC [Agromyces sp. LY-1074]MDR5704748.1 membrane protein insertase YidC [Agromyces sp. LY-1358]
MDLYAFPPIAAVLDGAYTVLMWLAELLEPLIGVTSAAAAIVLVTLIVRAVLIPTAVSMAKGEQTRARLAPKIQALQQKHKQNPERLQREMMKLYSDEGTSPLAGCLPMLVQAPVVGVIYALFILPTINGHDNALLTETVAGVPLGTSFVGSIAHGELTGATVGVFAVLVLLIAAVAEVTRRVFRPVTPPAPVPTGAAGPGAAAPLGGPGLVRALGFLQFATAVIALFVPLAAGIYLTTTVVWTLGQRMLLRRRYPLPVPPAAPA